MRADIARRFSKRALDEATREFGIQHASMRLVGDHQAFIYEGRLRSGGVVVLRCTHASHRCEDWIEAELEWIEYLASQGLPVARPLYSAKGKRVEPVGDGEFMACCFERAVGTFVRADQVTPEL